MPLRRRRRFILALAIAVVASMQMGMTRADQVRLPCPPIGFASVLMTLGHRFSPDQLVSCKSTVKWMNNEFGLSPCTVAYNLMLPCSDDEEPVVLPLNSSVNSYANPLQGQWCTCNTVVYNLMSACAVCQGGSPTDYDSWTSSCSNVTDDYPEKLIAESCNTPQWAYVNLTKRRTFNLAAAEEVAGADKSWTTVQIVIPIIVGVGVAVLAGLIFFCYRRRLKQRYTPIGGLYPFAPSHVHQGCRIYSQRSLPQSRPGHQQAASSSSLGLNSLYGRNSPVPTRKKSKAAVAWERARMNAPRKLGGLLPDRKKVHERTRGADWSIDADTLSPVDGYSHSKAGSSSSSGSGAGHSKEASGDSQLRIGANGSHPSHHSRSESRLGLLSDDSPERLNPIQDSPDLIREHSSSSFVKGLVSSLSGLSRIGRRQRPVAVESRPPRRGFKVDDVDSANSPTALRDVRESRFGSFPFPETALKGDIEAGPSSGANTMPSGARTSLNVAVTSEVLSSQNPSQSGSGGSRSRSDGVPDINPKNSGSGSRSGGEGREPGRGRDSVVLISRSPGQDFNSMAASSPINTEEASGFGSFAATAENDSWPAALTDISSVVGQTHHHAPIPPTPPPTTQTMYTAYSPSHSLSGTPRPPSRILIPPGNGSSQLLAPTAVRASGGYAPNPNPNPSQPPSSFSPRPAPALTSAGTLLSNSRLFSSGSVAESNVPEPPSAISAGGLTTEAGIAPASEHSSEAYTVPNPFVFDERRGGSVGAANALRMASPTRSRSRTEIIE